MSPENLLKNSDPERRFSRNNSDNSTAPSRRKRFIDSLTTANLTMFDADGDLDDAKSIPDNGLGTTTSTEYMLESLFSELYMKMNRSVRALLGHNITDMLLSCTFGGRTCYPGNFSLYQSDHYGNCWTISSKNFVVKSPGPSGGLSMMLYLENNEFLEGLTNSMGLSVVVHYPGTEPYPEDEGMLISAASETNIGLLRTSVTRLGGGNYGNCTDGSQFKTKYGVHYSRTTCEHSCRLSELLSTCGCYDERSENLANTIDEDSHLCSNETEVSCMASVLMRYHEKQLSCDCNNPCFEIQYFPTTSSRQWPSDSYALLLIQGVCEKHPGVCADMMKGVSNMRSISNNFLKLNIFYKSLNFENIEEIPAIEYPQFISSVGGALGLWIGLSVLSLCEIVQLVGELGTALVRHFCRH